MKRRILLLVGLLAVAVVALFGIRIFLFPPVSARFEDMSFNWLIDARHGEGVNTNFKGQAVPWTGATDFTDLAQRLCTTYGHFALAELKILKRHDPAFFSVTIIYGHDLPDLRVTHFYDFQHGVLSCDKELLPPTIQTRGTSGRSL